MSSVEAMDVITDDLNPLTPVHTFHASDMLSLRSMLDSRHHRNMTCEEVVDVLHGVSCLFLTKNTIYASIDTHL